MDSRRIDEMVWRALIDAPFREGLLNGHRGKLVSSLDLTDSERMVVLSVQADSLEAFAEALYTYVPSSAGSPSVAPMPSALGQGRHYPRALAARATL